MTKHDKLLKKVLSGRSDTNIDFDDVRRLLDPPGFDERIRGSHLILYHDNFLRIGFYLSRGGQKNG